MNRLEAHCMMISEPSANFNRNTIYVDGCVYTHIYGFVGLDKKNLKKMIWQIMSTRVLKTFMGCRNKCIKTYNNVLLWNDVVRTVEKRSTRKKIKYLPTNRQAVRVYDFRKQNRNNRIIYCMHVYYVHALLVRQRVGHIIGKESHRRVCTMYM